MNLLVGVVGLFVMTFILVSFFIITANQYLNCLDEPLESFVPECKVIEGRRGDFIISVMGIGLLMLLDVGIVYKLLVDYLV